MLILFNEDEFVYTNTGKEISAPDAPWTNGIALTMQDTYPANEKVVIGYVEERSDWTTEANTRINNYHSQLLAKGYEYPISGMTYGYQYLKKNCR